MAPTPSKSNFTPSASTKFHQTRTPLAKHRLNFTKENAAEHPVEVITRIRDHPEQNNNNPPTTALQLNADGKSLRLKTEIGSRDFTFDGISASEDQDLDAFYARFVESRISGIKLGQKCTIMMYGPTGSGKSHTMFGCSNRPGLVYNALKDILGEQHNNDELLLLSSGSSSFVHVTVLEIYNEEVFDLLSSTTTTTTTNRGGGFFPKFASKAKLEVVGKKAKNASFISGNEAAKIMKEIQKVEKRRIVKNTNCNERSSRSHCMIIVDVPTVGGQLMLVDMAGSENIEQAGQSGGLEAKMQTAKINQGNVALKRVVESIANGDSHVPFRDSKLTMLLQDSFEDDKTKILMILCASPDPKQLHKTMATFEYGAKAKCIVRGHHNTPVKAEDPSSSSAIILGSRVAALDNFICKLQMENKVKEKERNEAQRELQRKEEEVIMLRTQLSSTAAGGRRRGGIEEEMINLKVNERTLALKAELERKILDCQELANEVERFRRRLEDIESELTGKTSSAEKEEEEEEGGSSSSSSGFMKRLIEVYGDESDMVKSMDLDRSIEMGAAAAAADNGLGSKLATVYEEEDDEEDHHNNNNGEGGEEAIEEKRVIVVTPEPPVVVARETRIRNIFTLCGNYRELAQQNPPPPPGKKILSDNTEEEEEEEEECIINNRYSCCDDNADTTKVESCDDNTINVYVKWEASKDNPGSFIAELKITRDSTLAHLRKLIEIHLQSEQQHHHSSSSSSHAFTFLALGDDPVAVDKETATQTSKVLPACDKQQRGYLACLRGSILQRPPFSPLQNKLDNNNTTSSLTKKKQVDDFSPASTPFITARKYRAKCARSETENEFCVS
ncbi:hypothetical protein M569_09030 [Genlisea aurea]|uniref:Kinesin motor domain-containing protein n=1 Tax=Genlisea aurea TaxID=192259 RepID=S8CFR3_9LAMI|nr:hypothetical protein M569_09030 [Genlisea aurea]